MKWKSIKGYEGLYEVSDLGEIKSLGKGISTDPRTKVERILKTRIKVTGYVHVKLCKEGKGKHFGVHRLVAIAFLPNPNNLREVNHIDGNKANNALYNLEWSSTSDNQKHAFRLGLQVPIRGKNNKQSIPILQYDLNDVFLKEWDGVKEAIRGIGKLNSHGVISCCKKKPKHNTAYGFKWAYKYEQSKSSK